MIVPLLNDKDTFNGYMDKRPSRMQGHFLLCWAERATIFSQDFKMLI